MCQLHVVCLWMCVLCAGCVERCFDRPVANHARPLQAMYMASEVVLHPSKSARDPAHHFAQVSLPHLQRPLRVPTADVAYRYPYQGTRYGPPATVAGLASIRQVDSLGVREGARGWLSDAAGRGPYVSQFGTDADVPDIPPYRGRILAIQKYSPRHGSYQTYHCFSRYFVCDASMGVD